MTEPVDDGSTPEPVTAPTAFAPAPVVTDVPQVTDVERAQGYLRQHSERAAKFGANYDDVMKQRQSAVKEVQDTLNKTIQEMRDKHEGKGFGQINLPMANFAAGMLSGTGPGAGNFAAQLGAGMKAMSGSVERQRMHDTEFLKGIAELQEKSGMLGDVPLKDAAALAKAQQLEELKSSGALEKGIVSAKLDRPFSLGAGILMDPKTNKIINAYTQQEISLDPTKGSAGGNGQSLFGSDVHGEDYLKSITDPILRQAIKGYGDYDTPLSNMGRSPAAQAYQQMVFAHAKQYNPEFDAKQYNTIQKGQKDWTGNGSSAQQARAAANVAAHLDNMQSAAAGLDNGDFQKWNTVANWVQNNKGDPRVMAFETAKKAVMTELSSFLGKGHPAEGQIREWQDVVSQANSPKMLQAAIEQMAGIMHTQLENMGSTKTNDLGGKKQFTADSFLSESNKASLKNILTTDISTDGGRIAAMRRAENKKAAITGDAAKPNPPQAVWEQNIALLKKAPTPANRAYFDETFGPGSAAMVLGRR